MLRHLHRAIVILSCSMLLISACVKSEKRTTRKVDVSNMQAYQVDMGKPRIGVCLDADPLLRETLTRMLYIEIDDGRQRYGFAGDIYAADSADTTGLVFSPWINTPDSGLLIFAFRLAQDSITFLVNDMMTMPLRSDWYWQVEIGIRNSDRCARPGDFVLCRSYTLPRAIEESGTAQLYVAWRGTPIIAAS